MAMKATWNRKENVEDSLCAYCGDKARKGHVLGLVRCSDPNDLSKSQYPGLILEWKF